MNIPSTAYVAFGAILASLVAGYFSFLNLISSKETKTSEFRLSWIDGLREEIATFTAAIHELVRISAYRNELTSKEMLEISAEPIKAARECLSKIQLRLNPAHASQYPDGLEAKLMNEVQIAKESFNKQAYEEVISACDKIRVAAAPLLKQEWEKVKSGEPIYRRIRTIAWVTIVTGLGFLLIGAGWLLFSTPVTVPEPKNMNTSNSSNQFCITSAYKTQNQSEEPPNTAQLGIHKSPPHQ